MNLKTEGGATATTEDGGFIGGDTTELDIQTTLSVSGIVIALAGNPNAGLTVETAPKLVSDLMRAFGDGGTQLIEESAPQMEAPAFAGRSVADGPAVAIKKSVTPDAIISLENGQKYKTLTRHLTTIGLTPESYRKKWNLPADYPMVAQSYSELRSQRARDQGLGSRGTQNAPQQAATTSNRRSRKVA